MRSQYSRPPFLVGIFWGLPGKAKPQLLRSLWRADGTKGLRCGPGNRLVLDLRLLAGAGGFWRASDTTCEAGGRQPKELAFRNLAGPRAGANARWVCELQAFNTPIQAAKEHRLPVRFSKHPGNGAKWRQKHLFSTNPPNCKAIISGFRCFRGTKTTSR